MSESAGQHSGWLLDTEVRGEGEVQGDLGVVVMIEYNIGNGQFGVWAFIVILLLSSL